MRREWRRSGKQVLKLHEWREWLRIRLRFAESIASALGFVRDHCIGWKLNIYPIHYADAFRFIQQAPEMRISKKEYE